MPGEGALSLGDRVTLLEKQLAVLIDLVKSIRTHTATQQELVSLTTAGLNTLTVKNFNPRAFKPDGQCYGITTESRRCRIPVEDDQRYCNTHIMQDPAVLVATLEKLQDINTAE